MNRRLTMLTLLVTVPCAVLPALGGQLALSKARVRDGSDVTVSVNYRQGKGTPAAGVATDIMYDGKVFTNPRCAAGPALPSSGGNAKSVRCAEQRPGVLRLLVYGLNLDPVPDGEVATVTLSVASGARKGLYRFRHKATAADANGRDFALSHRTGAVRVGGQ